MALNLSMREGDTVRVGSKMVHLEEIVDPTKSTFRIENPDKTSRFVQVVAEENTEVLPTVFVVVGERSNYSTANLVFEAPKDVIIERMIKVREFFIAPKVIARAIKEQVVANEDEALDLIEKSTPYSSPHAEGRNGDILINITPSKRVVNLFRIDNPKHIVTVVCDACEAQEIECDKCKNNGYLSVTLGYAMLHNMEVVSDGDMED